MTFEIPKERQINGTNEYKAFSEDLEYLSEFLINLSDLIFYSGHTVSFFSDKEIFELNTSLIESSAHTLESIKLCCSIGSFSDANSLIRKFRDDLLQYVYIINIVNLRKPFLDESIDNLKTDNADDFADSIMNVKFNPLLTDNEEAVTAWFKNKVADLPWPIKNKLGFKNYMVVLKQNSSIQHILTQYKLEKYWKHLTEKLNDYVHNNGSSFARHNFITARDKNLALHLENINTQTSYIASFFLVLVLMIESSLISSSDYIDHLDLGMNPPPDSQYLIANFVQDFIDKKVSKLHPELKQYLKDNNIRGMIID